MTTAEPQMSDETTPIGTRAVGGDDPSSAVLAVLRVGDLSGLDSFVNSQKVPLFRYLHHQLGDQHAAEDLVQDVFLRAIRAARAGTFDGKCSVRTWLFRIARNCLTDYARRSRLRVTHVLDDASSAVSDAPGPLSMAAAAEGTKRVQDMLDKIPAVQAQVLSLKVLGGLTAAEISEVTDVPLETIKSRLRYALQKVHEMLLAQGETSHD
jgi:RNA polymerase sigma factor (sigma-70 family)